MAPGAMADAIPAELPSPRSPTLSFADLILPEPPVRSFSPSPFVERPPSPPSLPSPQSQAPATVVKLTPPPPGRRTASLRSPPLSAQSSRSTLRTMGGSEGSGSGSSRRSAGRRAAHDALASSPTIADPLGSHPPRRLSNTSSSVRSEDLEAIKWSAYRAQSRFDDSGVVLEHDDDEDDDEERDQFPVSPNVHDDMENDRWLDGQSDGDDDMYSSAALSKRAEMILANAKKRLNVMEGNLRGARQSLILSPTSNELTQQLALSRERDRKLFMGIGPIPPRTKPYYSSPLSSSPGHARGLSDMTYSPSSYATRIQPSKRASSALGTARPPWSPEGFGQGRFPIRGSRSFETMREHQYTSHAQNDNHLESRTMSPPNLETLPEDDSPELQHKTSHASDLRSQMKDFKGRISSLKVRAQEDNMRRKSMQSLRTPSPFTCAETWYTEAEAYKSGGSPVSADAGVGNTTTSPVRKTLFEEETSSTSTPKPSSAAASRGEGASTESDQHASENAQTAALPETKTSEKELGQAERTQPDWDLDVQGANNTSGPLAAEDSDNDDPFEYDTDNDFMSLDGDEIEAAAESVYEDAVYEMPVAERHEDRIDAFDYETFFLHSAMGTYGLDSRRSSSSGESVATTRPLDNQTGRPESMDAKARVSMHARNPSADSVSTVATFATAAEDLSDDEENEQMDQFSQQLLGAQHIPPSTNVVLSPRLNSANGFSRVNGTLSRSSSHVSDAASGLQTSNIYSVLLGSPAQEEPRLALSEEEKQLIYSLASSFQQVCANLQSTSGDQYERKEWRRRLDEARRVLSGEELEGLPF